MKNRKTFISKVQYTKLALLSVVATCQRVYIILMTCYQSRTIYWTEICHYVNFWSDLMCTFRLYFEAIEDFEDIGKYSALNHHFQKSTWFLLLLHSS